MIKIGEVTSVKEKFNQCKVVSVKIVHARAERMVWKLIYINAPTIMYSTKITDLSASSVAMPASIATTPGNLDGFELKGIALPVTPIPRKSPSSGAGLP